MARDDLTERGVGADTTDCLELDGEPVGILGRDRLERRSQAALEPDAREALRRPDGQCREEGLLVLEVVEDRPAREPALGLETRDGRTLVAVAGEAALGSGEDLLAPALLVRVTHLWHCVLLYKTVQTFYILPRSDRCELKSPVDARRRRARLDPRDPDDLSGPAVVRARHDGLGEQDDDRPRRRDDPDGALRRSQRNACAA